MSLIKCPECAKKISDKAATCPNCGFPISNFKEHLIKDKGSLEDTSNINIDNESKSKDLGDDAQSILQSNKKTTHNNIHLFAEKSINSGKNFVKQTSNQFKQIEHKRLIKLIKIFSITFLTVFIVSVLIIKLFSFKPHPSTDGEDNDTITVSNTIPQVSEAPIQESDIPSPSPVLDSPSPEPEKELLSTYMSLEEFNLANMSEPIMAEEMIGIWASEKDADGIEYSIILTESGFLFYRFTNSEKSGEAYGLYEYDTENNSNVLILHPISGGKTEYQVVKANNKYAMKTPDTDIVLTKVQSENAVASGEATVTQQPEHTKVTQQPEQTSTNQEFEVKPKLSDTIAVAGGHVVGLRKDGTVVSVGYSDYNLNDVSSWNDIVAISTGSGHTIGLKKDGTVVAVGNNMDGQCDVSEWTDIVAISAGDDHTIGVKRDGTVVATGDNLNGQCDVSEWTDIVAVSTSYSCTAGLKRDGTVVAVGDNTNGQCDVSEWTDIVAVVVVEDNCTIGIKKDETIVVTEGFENYGADYSSWTSIIDVAGTSGNLFGLEKDGSVLGLYNDSVWTDIVAIKSNSLFTIGLKNDGTVVFLNGANEYLSDLSPLTNIGLPGGN